MNHDRLELIEEQIAHLTRASEDMSEMIRRQSDEIARLKRLCTQLAEREADRAAQDSTTIPLADQKPPHW